jgi:hypothetical protein
LLKVRYGIDRTAASLSPRWDDSEWGVWYSALGKPLRDFQEASIVSRTFLGCGLAGLTALYALPALRGRYFIALCATFTLGGCFSSVDLLLWRVRPVRRGVARLKSVLLELSEASAIAERRKGDSASIGIDADGD